MRADRLCGRVIMPIKWCLMREPVLLPDLGVERARLSVWYANPGDAVYAGDRLVEVIVNGAAVAISSPANGWLAEKAALPDDSLTSGQILGSVEVEPEAEH